MFGAELMKERFDVGTYGINEEGKPSGDGDDLKSTSGEIGRSIEFLQ